MHRAKPTSAEAISEIPPTADAVRPVRVPAFERQWATDLAMHERTSAATLLVGSALGLTLFIAHDHVSIPALAGRFAVCRILLSGVAIAVVVARRTRNAIGPWSVTAVLLLAYAFFAWGVSVITDPSALVAWNMNIAVAGVFWPAVVWVGPVRRAVFLSAAFAAMVIGALLVAGRVPIWVVWRSGGLSLAFAWCVGPLITMWRIRSLRGESQLRYELLQKTAEAEARREALSFQATHDAMTGLLNRSSGMQLLAHARERGRRHRTPLTVAYVDLDGLKRVNDELGHAAGDEMIRVAAAILRTAVRGSDVLCRMGGDEFIAVLDDCTAAAAARVVARWSAEVDAYNASSDGAFTVGFSVGLAEWSPDSSLGIEDVVAQADLEMFAQKRAARRARA